MIMSIEGLKKSYGEKLLFSDVSFSINEDDKIGIVGVNGTGKSTFLRTIAGETSPDEGEIKPAKGLRLEYLPQEKEPDPNNTILMEAFRTQSPLMKALFAYETALVQSERSPKDRDIQSALAENAEKIDALSGWKAESDAKTILTKLGLGDFSRKAGTLSGGEKKRLALASALIQPSDLLLLDEPTNHLDSMAIEWLEDYLKVKHGALLIVTHDRYFLDHTADRILELDKGYAYTYSGNYTDFLEQKEARIEREEASERKRQNFLRTELQWMRRGAQARSTKQRARIERYEKVRAEKHDLSRNVIEAGLAGSRLGRTVIELKNAGYSENSMNIINGLTYTVLRNDRIGIIGPNGSGKSTLLDMLSGRLKPTIGTLKIGQTVKIGYFTQGYPEMDERIRAIDYIEDEVRTVTLSDGTSISASQMMEKFLFPPNLQYAPISKLSGGEKRRLYLLHVLMGAPNVLLLDEPTNDLDLETMQVLEGFIDDFSGAIIFVSHDRFFVDRLADKIFVIAHGGVVHKYPGGYTDNAYRFEAAMPDNSSTSKAQPMTQQHHEQRYRMSYNEKREYDSIEGVITEKENEQKAIEAMMAACASDYGKLAELSEDNERLKSEIDTLMERWAYLEELANKEREEA